MDRVVVEGVIICRMADGGVVVSACILGNASEAEGERVVRPMVLAVIDL